MNIGELTARYKAVWGMYWMDKMVEALRRQYRDQVLVTGTVLAVLRNERLGLESLVPGLNIVTNDGDTYYAQSAVGEAPDDDFDDASSGLRLGDDNTSPTKTDTDVTAFLATSAHALDGTYPMTDDSDGDNTGSGVDIVSWRYSYLISEGNVVDIIEGAVVDDRTTPTAALTHFLFAGVFTKTSSDTLKVFVNHTMNGV